MCSSSLWNPAPQQDLNIGSIKRAFELAVLLPNRVASSIIAGSQSSPCDLERGITRSTARGRAEVGGGQLQRRVASDPLFKSDLSVGISTRRLAARKNRRTVGGRGASSATVAVALSRFNGSNSQRCFGWSCSAPLA